MSRYFEEKACRRISSAVGAERRGQQRLRATSSPPPAYTEYPSSAQPALGRAGGKETAPTSGRKRKRDDCRVRSCPATSPLRRSPRREKYSKPTVEDGVEEDQLAESDGEENEPEDKQLLKKRRKPISPRQVVESNADEDAVDNGSDNGSDDGNGEPEEIVVAKVENREQQRKRESRTLQIRRGIADWRTLEEGQTHLEATEKGQILPRTLEEGQTYLEAIEQGQTLLEAIEEGQILPEVLEGRWMFWRTLGKDQTLLEAMEEDQILL
ncbi:unnamed protein product [Zymoseptoria tritici ST99CH_3D1]|nr:unnamed protein product [Zymoseptoria tritici ST99CH_3D1]